jgi:hypothetical protein
MDVHPTKNVSIGIDPYPYGVLKGRKKAGIFLGILWDFFDRISRDFMGISFDLIRDSMGFYGI